MVDLLQPLVRVLGKVVKGDIDLAQDEIITDGLLLLTIKRLGIAEPAREVLLPEEGTPLEPALPLLTNEFLIASLKSLKALS